mgnify:FL=1
MQNFAEKLADNFADNFAYANVIRVFLYMLRWAAFFLMATLLLNCRKPDVSSHPVPSVPVSIMLYTNDPLYFNLQNIGGWQYISGGVQGIILYRKSAEEFVALERASTQNPSDSKSRIQVLNDNYTLLDSVSGSQWSILDGQVIKGPASWGLRLYGTSFNGQSLRIIN